MQIQCLCKLWRGVYCAENNLNAKIQYYIIQQLKFKLNV